MKPELLAPAGSIESFHAAIDAGADAVYLGLGDFNARLRAKNFTAGTLSYLLPFAHKHGVKLYVTLNTLIKQAELGPVIHTLYQIEQIGVDALIVADAGVIDIAHRHFPRMRLHASTQMAVHNSAGVRAAQNLGLRRAVLSRELTLEEIGTIQKRAAIELEVFIHGALCYSISGLCLASSFLGGSSGNRGRCTQVCRRKFKTGTGAAQGFFSPNDLCAFECVPQLMAMGIAGLKIEGRMKSAAYVFTAVDAYRRLIDGEISIEKARELSARDLARKKTTLFLLGAAGQSGVIDAATRSGIGEYIGTVVEADKDLVIVTSEGACAGGDRIRIQPENGFEGIAVDLRSAVHENGRLRLRLKTAVECSAGDAVFLIGRHGEGARFDRKGVTGVEPVHFATRCPFVSKIMQDVLSDNKGGGHGTSSQSSPDRMFENSISSFGRLRTNGRNSLVSSDSPSHSARGKLVEPTNGNYSNASRRDTLWIKIDTLGWLDLAVNTPCQRLVFAGDRHAMETLLHDEARLKIWRSRLSIALSPFIPETETSAWQQLAGRYKAAGIEKGVCSNIGHAELFPIGFAIVADNCFGCLNRASLAALGKRGFGGVIRSYEDDYLNIKASTAAAAQSSPGEIVCLFSHVPLFISRIRPALPPGTVCVDLYGNGFFIAEAHGLFYLVSKKPFCLTHRRQKLSETGINGFLLDLSFCKPSPDLLQPLIRCYKNNTRLPDSGLFNFKAGLK